MKKFIIKHAEAIKTFFSAIAFISALILLYSCQAEPEFSQQPTLPAEQNFEQPEKIWTEEDFKNAELDELDVDYLVSDYPPDMVTEEDIRRINEHHQRRLQRLIAGAK